MTRTQDTTASPSSDERSQPGIPVRTSSYIQTQTLASSPAPEAVAETKAVSRKGSKDSIKEKRRSASLGSTRRSKEKPAAPAVAEQEKPGPNLQAPSSAEKPKKRGIPKFLSLLGCCGAQDDAQSPDASEPAVPPKKAKVLQPSRNRQPTPSSKVEKESGTGESKEVPQETIGGTPYSEQTAAKKPKMVTRHSKEHASKEKSTSLGNGQASEKESIAEGTHQEQPLPPLPATKPLSNQPCIPAAPSKPEVVPIPPPTQSQTTSAEEDVVEEGQVINDRTPEQAKRDSDIEMTQAPPIAPEAGDVQRNAEPEKERQQTQSSLPPPPPRNNQSRGSSPADRSPAAERQQWLLPPIQPRFQGKKCLVLDLDETLVHSSFKVCHKSRLGSVTKLTCLDSSSSGFHHPRRD